MAARLAEKQGYTNVKVFHAGIPAWRKQGNPVLTTTDFVNDRLGYIVLVDTRGMEAAKKGYIQGAVAIPSAEIVKEREQFPLDRKAYIVFYAEETGMDQLAPIVKEVSTWGYQRLLILDGGYKGWIAANGPIQKDVVRTKIFYLPRPHPGEITGDEFMNIVRNKPEGKLILDVRTDAETAGGMIPGAMGIPVDELQSRLSELPTDKEIIAHCRSGLRAEMAYNILRNAKHNARFLNDKVETLENRIFCCFK
jgi:rhodanese-related sulfurtransferase